MTMPKTVTQYLRELHIPYSVVRHPRTHSTRETAHVAYVPSKRVAKAVVFGDKRGGYVMAVVPGNRYVSINKLSKKLRRELTLVSERRLVSLFRDCALGAIPPVGPAYGVETFVDDRLVGQPEVYFEAGDHEGLVRVEGEQFLSLLKHAGHGKFCH